MEKTYTNKLFLRKNVWIFNAKQRQLGRGIHEHMHVYTRIQQKSE